MCGHGSVRRGGASRSQLYVPMRAMCSHPRGQVTQTFAACAGTPVAQFPDGLVYADGVPQRDGGADEVEATSPIHLVLVGAVAHLAEAVEEDRPREDVASLALVEPGGNPSSDDGDFSHSSAKRVRSILPIVQGSRSQARQRCRAS